MSSDLRKSLCCPQIGFFEISCVIRTIRVVFSVGKTRTTPLPSNGDHQFTDGSNRRELAGAGVYRRKRNMQAEMADLLAVAQLVIREENHRNMYVYVGPN